MNRVFPLGNVVLLIPETLLRNFCNPFSLLLQFFGMDFFSRGYTALRGERGQPQSADETIEKLADCLETATLLEDRRAGVLSLKGLVRDWPEVAFRQTE